MSIDIQERIAILEKLKKIKERKKEQDDFLSFCIKSFPRYKAGWVHEEICKKLEKFAHDVYLEKSPRLMIFMPPRHGKSFLVSERFPAWVLGKYPYFEFISATYGKSLTQGFSRKCRNLIHSKWIKEIFPNFDLKKDSKSVDFWETTYGGAFIATSIGGSVTGKGAHILSIDDPHKGIEEVLSEVMRNKTHDWYKTDAFTRLLPGGGVILTLTRWHDDDLAARILAEDTDNEWEVICYPAIATEDEAHRKKGEALHPERYPLKMLQKLLKTLGSFFFNALYQQDPVPASGTVFKKEFWRFYNERFTFYDKIIQVWDLSFKGDEKSDYTVGQVWGKKGANFYLLDQVRGQWEFTQQIEQIKMLSKKYPLAYSKYIEEKATATAVISTLKKEITGLIPFNPKSDKYSRALVAQPPQQAGNIHLPNPQLNPWVNDYIDEHSRFPKGKNDDQVDCTSLAMIQLNNNGLEHLKALVS
nr:phage terminase large subunit [Pigmentibacter ruber]